MPITPRQSASIRSSWTRLSSARPKNPSTSPRTSQRTLLTGQRHLHVVLVRAATDREDDAARAAHLDHLATELRHGRQRGAGEAEDAVAAAEPDARDRAAGTHLGDREPVLIGGCAEAELVPHERVRVGVGEGSGRDRDLALLAVLVAADEQAHRVAHLACLD